MTPTDEQVEAAMHSVEGRPVLDRNANRRGVRLNDGGLLTRETMRAALTAAFSLAAPAGTVEDDVLKAMHEAMFDEPYDASTAPMVGAGYDAAKAALVSQPQPEGEVAITSSQVQAFMDSMFGEYTSPGNDETWVSPDWAETKNKVWVALSAAALHPAPTLQGAGLIEEFSKHTNWSLEYFYDEDDGWWAVHEVSGNINDREWVKVGRGDTAAEAVRAALSPQRGAGK